MKLKDWAAALSEQVNFGELAIAVGIIVLFWLLSKFVAVHLFKYVFKRIFRGEHALNWIQSFEKPLILLVKFLGFYLALKYLIPSHWILQLYVNRVFRCIGIVLVGWGIYNLSSTSSKLLEGIGRRVGLDESSMLIPFLSKVLRFLVIVIIVALVGAEWGFSINGLVAGMGLGSLAIALAAKETLGNIFGGIVIIVEKPFAKGDWILTPSGEGIVEDITFRSTKIRTFADAVVTIPNASLVDQPITNWSQMGRRRVTFILNVALDSDREGLKRAVERIEQLLITDEEVHPQTIMVKFRDFQESSLGIFIYYFTKTTVWAEHLTVQEKINFAIMDILEQEHIKLAFPMQRVVVEENQRAEGEREFV